MSKLVKIITGALITASIGFNGIFYTNNVKLSNNVLTLQAENVQLKKDIKAKDYEIQKLYMVSLVGDYTVIDFDGKKWFTCENIATGQKLDLNKMFTPDWLKVGTEFHYNENEEVLKINN